MYDAKNATEYHVLVGETADGVVTQILDGKIRDFVSAEGVKKFKEPDGSAIYVTVEFKYQGRLMRKNKLFSYAIDEDGKTNYAKKSSLGKYRAFYNKLPEVGDKVFLMSDINGYFQLML